MDSVTQFLLGAAIGGAVLGPRAGRKGLLWGAVCGTLPDLDIFIPRADPVAEFTYHRGFSHAIFYLTLATPLIAWIMERIHADLRQMRIRSLLAVWLALVTHPLLDCFTVYGTQIMLPFSNYPVSWSTIFIIDPIYTVPLGITVVMAWLRFPKLPGNAVKLCVIGLAVSCAYLLATVAIKSHVDSVTRRTIAQENIVTANAEPFLSTPAPFNTVLWRIVVMTPDGYLEGFYSLLDRTDTITFAAHESHPSLLDSLNGDWAVERLKWFTHGFYRVAQSADGITITDLRMGFDPFYVFSFRVAQENGGHIEPVSPQQITGPLPSPAAFTWIWHRIWNATPAK